MALLLACLFGAHPWHAAGLSPSSILANSAVGLSAVLLRAAAALASAALSTAVGLRWMSERATRRVLALILAFASSRLLLR